MRFATTAVLSALFSALSVSAVTFNVTVGANGTLLYEPQTVTAAVGDVVAFQFLSKNHTVTQSTFADPCTKKSDGVDSGYQFVAQNATSFPQWSITINNASAPLWFYCAQAPHCQRGMVFAVNPTAERTFDAFKATAMGTNGTTGGAGGSSTTGPSGTNTANQPNNSGGANNNAAVSVASGTMSAALISLGSLLLGTYVL